MANRLNYIHWLEKPQELGSGEMTLSYGSNGLQTELFTTFRATFLQIKKGTVNWSESCNRIAIRCKIQLSYDLNQSAILQVKKRNSKL